MLFKVLVKPRKAIQPLHDKCAESITLADYPNGPGYDIEVETRPRHDGLADVLASALLQYIR